MKKRTRSILSTLVTILLCLALLLYGVALGQYREQTGGIPLPVGLWLFPLLLFLAAVALCAILAAQSQAGLPARPEDAYQGLEPLIEHLQAQSQQNRLQTQQLDQRQREFAAVTEHMQEGFLLLDHNGRILSRNRSALTLLGLEAARPGDDLRQLCRDRSLQALPDLLDQALSGGHGELQLRRGGAVCQVMANAVRSGEEPIGAVLILMDVTEQAHREELRREFSANVSHELRTPLTSISGFAELMQAGLVPMDKVREFSGDIHREAQRLLQLVNDIIKLSRLDEGADLPEAQPVRLTALCESVLAQLTPVAEKQGVTLRFSGDAQPILGQEQLLWEMLYNLCDNAIKYNRPDGQVAVSLQSAGGDVILQVSDTGIGIPYDHQSRVFERFYRVDKSHSKVVGGTGLGLSIVKHAAQYHSARIELESEPDTGTTIRVLFPKPVGT